MSPAIWGPLCAFLSSVTWAIGSSTYSRLALNYSPFAVNFTRALVGFPLFIFAVLIGARGTSSALDQILLVPPEAFGWFAMSMICSYGLGDVCFILSSRSLGVPGALALASTYPIYNVAFDAVTTNRFPSLIQVSGVLLTILGVITVILQAPRNPPPVTPMHSGAVTSLISKKSMGVVLALLTSFFWAANNFAIAQGGKAVDAIMINAIRLPIGMGVIFVLSRLLDRPKPRPLVIPVLRSRGIFGVFLLETVGGSLFFAYGLTHSSRVLGPVLTSLAPVIAVPIAWALGMERFSWFRSLGVGLVVLGLWLTLLAFS